MLKRGTQKNSSSIRMYKHALKLKKEEINNLEGNARLIFKIPEKKRNTRHIKFD